MQDPTKAKDGGNTRFLGEILLLKAKRKNAQSAVRLRAPDINN